MHIRSMDVGRYRYNYEGFYKKFTYQERKKRKERILTRIVWAPSILIILSLFIDIWYVNFSLDLLYLCLYLPTYINLMGVTL